MDLEIEDHVNEAAAWNMVVYSLAFIDIRPVPTLGWSTKYDCFRDKAGVVILWFKLGFGAISIHSWILTVGPVATPGAGELDHQGSMPWCKDVAVIGTRAWMQVVHYGPMLKALTRVKGDPWTLASD
ncbi:hypothetical protein EJ05DRAFT_481767 [Pseudovirgaria hyperparasitica]|uniref:Uncharacterized protein n=1 Tax=Pseudovirgaria hyperparasitica TaxID=470096 RepID=A0A6A6WL34_9PEZI|nr:uncharacterized protein EJ05DRAFT_481767 [Pseudovirgaria hyperparasitica]KAF2762891.1 hypothetical protein EJ05DRAFT_481767 [Pseudovirgaria hyperparasitica]